MMFKLKHWTILTQILSVMSVQSQMPQLHMSSARQFDSLLGLYENVARTQCKHKPNMAFLKFKCYAFCTWFVFLHSIRRLCLASIKTIFRPGDIIFPGRKYSC